MDAAKETNKQGPKEKKGGHLNEAFRAHPGSLNCGCSSNPGRMLQPGSNLYPELVQKIVNSIDRTSRYYLRRQKSARDLLLDLETQMQEVWTTSTRGIEQIQKHLECFDDFWFLGLLEHRCKVRLIVASDPLDLQDSGLSKPTSERIQHRQVHEVETLLRREPLDCPNNHRCQIILGTLLHELCHAVVIIYGCKCYSSLADYLYYHGIEGHGKAWADLFLSVRASARNVFELDIDLDWHYNYSMELEAASLEQLVMDGGGYGFRISAFQPGTVMNVPANEELEMLWREWKRSYG